MRSGQKELENILAKSKQQQQQQQQIQNNNQQLHSDQQEYELLLPHHRVGDVSTRSGVVGTVVVAHTEDDYDVIGGVGKANENIIGGCPGSCKSKAAELNSLARRFFNN